MDGSDPPDWVRDEGRHDRSGEGEAAGWRDADTVEFGKEQEPSQAEGDKMPISRPNELDIREYIVRLLVNADEPVSKKRVVGLYQTLNHHEARYRLSPGEAHEVAPGPSARRLLRLLRPQWSLLS